MYRTPASQEGVYAGQEITFNTSDHYEIETTYQLLSGGAEEVGLIFGQDFSRNHYYFSILPDGNWSISILRPTGKVPLSNGYRRNLQIFAENKLTVRKIDYKWHFYVNEELIQSMDACDMFGQWIGLRTAPHSQVDWKKLSVSRLIPTTKRIRPVNLQAQPFEPTFGGQSQVGEMYNPFPENEHYQPYILKEPNQVPLPPTPREAPVKATPSYGNPVPRTGSGRNFLLLIAANDYLFWTDLNNALKDASDVGNVLIQNYQFDEARVFKLLGEQATRENILETLEALQRNILPDDNLLIYYAGHGFYDPDNRRGYWVPKDARIGKISDYIRNTTIMDYLTSINSRNTLLISDACYAGSISNYSMPSNHAFNGGIWVLTSGDIEKVWDGKPGENSPFAKYLISTLINNQKEYMTFSELSESVKVLVRRYTPQNPVDFTLPKNLRFETDFILRKRTSYGINPYGRN